MGNYFGDGNTGKFFLNRPFSKVGIASGSGPHRYKERSHAGHFAFARHNMSYFLNEQTLPSHPFLALGLELSYNLNNWIYQLMFLILENWVDKMAYMSLNKGPAGHFFKLPTPSCFCFLHPDCTHTLCLSQVCKLSEILDRNGI